jgi:uncharacterized membrane protein
MKTERVKELNNIMPKAFKSTSKERRHFIERFILNPSTIAVLLYLFIILITVLFTLKL